MVKGPTKHVQISSEVLGLMSETIAHSMMDDWSYMTHRVPVGLKRGKEGSSIMEVTETVMKKVWHPEERCAMWTMMEVRTPPSFQSPEMVRELHAAVSPFPKVTLAACFKPFILPLLCPGQL